MAGITGYVKWFLVNWLDNFLYTVVIGENTVAFFFSVFLSIERGEWVGWVWS